MKRFYILALVISYSLLNNSCKKDSNTTDTPGLPPATQNGANTFGCMVNGQPWVPQGYGGFNNLSIDYDPGFSNGILDIQAVNFSTSPTSRITVGIIDSLNFMTFPKKIKLFKGSLFTSIYIKNCILRSDVIDVNIIGGEIEISTLNKQTGFVSGKFEFSLEKKDCDTIKITQGRFDLKF